MTNFSYYKAQQLASEIVVTLSEQNTSQALYFKKIFIGMNTWRPCLLWKILLSRNSLLHHDAKSS